MLGVLDAVTPGRASMAVAVQPGMHARDSAFVDLIDGDGTPMQLKLTVVHDEVPDSELAPTRLVNARLRDAGSSAKITIVTCSKIRVDASDSAFHGDTLIHYDLETFLTECDAAKSILLAACDAVDAARRLAATPEAASRGHVALWPPRGAPRGGAPRGLGGAGCRHRSLGGGAATAY